jgi:hypothetical protein
MEEQEKQVEKVEKKETNQKIISASISKEFYEIARARGISWSEAMRIGLAILFAEKGIKEYKNDITISRITAIFNAISSK